MQPPVVVVELAGSPHLCRRPGFRPQPTNVPTPLARGLGGRPQIGYQCLDAMNFSQYAQRFRSIRWWFILSLPPLAPLVPRGAVGRRDGRRENIEMVVAVVFIYKRVQATTTISGIQGHGLLSRNVVAAPAHRTALHVDQLSPVGQIAQSISYLPFRGLRSSRRASRTCRGLCCPARWRRDSLRACARSALAAASSRFCSSDFLPWPAIRSRWNASGDIHLTSGPRPAPSGNGTAWTEKA